MIAKAVPSMDGFKEMIEIEKQFGAIKLGHDTEKSPLELNKTRATPYWTRFDSDRDDFSGIDHGKPSLWSHLAQSCLNETPKKFRHFLELIDKATVEKYSIIEM